MTRLPTISARKLIQALERAGFEPNGQKGSHFYLWHPIKKVTTCVPLHGGDLKRSLVLAIMHQVGLTEEELLDLLWPPMPNLPCFFRSTLLIFCT